MKREIFNRHYSCASYFVALQVADIPVLLLSILIVALIPYLMTNQPLESFRIGCFLAASISSGFASQGLGLFSGSTPNLLHTLVISACTFFLFSIFCGYFVLMKDTGYGWHWLFYISYGKHSLDANLLAILGFDRPKLDCNVIYCHFRWPHKFLETLGVDGNYSNALVYIIISIFVFRIAAYFLIRRQLKH